MSRKRTSPVRAILLAAAFSLFLFSGAGLCRGVAAPGRDADGGYSGDYSHIPLLKWAGPGAPGTFEKYMLRRPNEPFRAVPIGSYGAPRTAGRPNKALVLVNSALYGSIQSRLAAYAADLVDDGYAVEGYQISGGTAESLKTFIIAHSTDLAGCAFVGDIAAAWYEYQSEEFPCDLFFMDLDGEWLDTDHDGKYDAHGAGTGDEGPEIFVGRIDASMMSGDEVRMTNDYFDKDHLYRNGGYYPPSHALTYTEDDWASYMDMRTDIKYAYSSFDDVPAPATNRDDYVNNRITDPGYEFIQLACHSWSQGHAFTRGGYAYNSDIQGAPPVAVFYNLFCCSSLRFTDPDFLGGAYVYDTGSPSLAVIGSTKTGSMLEFWAFYQPFGAYETFGEALKVGRACDEAGFFWWEQDLPATK